MTSEFEGFCLSVPEQVDGADTISRAQQGEFLVFGHIVQMDGAEFPRT